jgi:non-specific serine/threonine protein kinase
LTVFAGGIALPAAEEIANPDGDLDVLSGLAVLVDESLLRQSETPGGEPRFTMLETVREFGLDGLTAAGEETGLRTRHAAWFLQFAEAGEQAVHGPEQITWLDRLELERDNLRAAFTWMLERGDIAAALQLGRALEPLWELRGTMREWRTWIERALEHADDLPREELALALFQLSALLSMEGDFAQVEHVFARATAAADGLDDPLMPAWARFIQAQIAAAHGDQEHATELIEEAVDRFLRLGLGPVHPLLLTTRARMEYRRGHRDRGRALFKEALATFRTLAGDRQWIAEALNSLGDIDCDQGDFVDAAAKYAEALMQSRTLKDTWSTSDSVLGFAAVATGIGHAERGARLLGAADALYVQIGIVLPPVDRDNYPGTLSATRAALGEAGVATAHAAGSTWTMEQAVAEALALADELAAEATPRG